MAAKTTNKTIWTLALVGVIGFLAWKLWPALKKRISGSSASSGGPVGGASSYSPYSPYSQQPQTQGLNFGLPNLPGSRNSNSSLSGNSNTVSSFEDAITNDYFASQAAFGEGGTIASEVQAAIDNLTANDYVPYEQTQNLPLEGWAPDDPNAPWNVVGQDEQDNSSDQGDDSLSQSSYSEDDSISDDGSDYGALSSGYADDNGINSSEDNGGY